MLRRVLTSPLSGLALLVAGSAALVARVGVDNHNPQPDELLNIIGARLLEQDFAGTITDAGVFNRGPERLTALVLWAVNEIVPGTAAEMQAGHVVLAVLCCSVAVPAYALARGQGLSARAALATAALSVLTPWLVLPVSFLNVALAIPTLGLLVWATWHAAVRPSPGADVLVLLAAGLAVLARTGSLPLLAATAVVLVVQTWREAGLRSLPVALVRRHAVLVGAGLLLLAAIVAKGPDALAGSAYHGAVNDPPSLEELWSYLPELFAQLSMGTGWLPMVFGLPWVVVQAVRPSTPATGAFAVTALAMFAVFVYTAASAGAQLEERYIGVLVILPAVAGGVALFRRELSVVGCGLAAVLVAVAARTQGLYPSDGPNDYYVAPARQWFSNVLTGKVDVALGSIGNGDAATVVAVAFAIVAIAIVVAVRQWPDRATPVVVMALLAVGLAGGVWALRKYHDTGLEAQLGWNDLTWIDRITGGERALLYDDNPGDGADRRYLVGQARSFNAALGPQAYLPKALGPGGRIVLPTGETVPGWLVSFSGFREVVPDATPAARSAIYPLPMRVERFAPGPPRALVLVPVGEDRWLHRPVAFELFGRARSACLVVPMEAATDSKRPAEVTLGTARVTIPPGHKRTVIVPAGGRDRLRFDPGDGAGVALGDITVRDC